MREDITYCSNKECSNISCERHPKNIRRVMLHSFADLEGTEYCSKEEDQYKNQGRL